MVQRHVHAFESIGKSYYNLDTALFLADFDSYIMIAAFPVRMRKSCCEMLMQLITRKLF